MEDEIAENKQFKTQMYTFIEKIRYYMSIQFFQYLKQESDNFKISDVCQTTFDVKNDLRFYVEYIFLRFSTKYGISALYTSMGSKCLGNP